jgi:polysaccharide biosynthesis transport protein
MKSDIKYYLARFLRRFPVFLLVVVLITSVGVTAAFMLPSVYRAEARLLVESPQIPDEMAPTTVRTAAAEILQVIQQRLTTRDKIIDLARKLKVYEGRDLMDPDKVVMDMNGRIRIQLPGSGDAAAFVTVSFDAATPELSARVTNDLVDSIIEESIALRTANASQTLEFFQSEVNRLNEQLGALGGKILQLKLDKKDALPDSLEFRRTRQTATQERLRDIERQIAGLQDRRTRLVDLYQKTGTVELSGEAGNSRRQRLQQLEQELAQAKSIYSADNPKVRLIEAQIATLKRSELFDLSAETQDEPMNNYELQLADLDGQIEFLQQDKTAIETELAALQASIDATPGNAIELDVLQRDYDNIQIQYNTAVARLSEAATGDRIESLSKGQRISVIEPATAPTAAAKPNRMLIAVTSLLVALAAGFGLVFLLEKLNRAIERPVDLETALGITPIATIPYFSTRRELWRRRLVWLLVFGICGLVLAAIYVERDGLAAPLIDLLLRVFERAGLAALTLPAPAGLA